MFISEAIAQTTTGAPAPTGSASDSLFGSLGSMLPLVLMFVVLYFVMIRPQMKRQKEHKAMVDALAKGDEVVTAGGILGRVVQVKDAYVTLEVATGTEMIVQKNAVTTLLPKGTLKSL